MHNRAQFMKDLAASKAPKKLKKPKDVLISDQWKDPGKITKVMSGNITMKGVPYPVLGIDDQGNHQMMHPGADYQFPGNSVTEYPMSGGGWLDTYPEGGPKLGQIYDRLGRRHSIPSYVPWAQTGGAKPTPWLEGYNEPSEWMGNKYHDYGVSKDIGNFNISAGNYIPRSTMEKEQEFNPHINLEYSPSDKHTFGLEATPGYAGLSYKLNFQKGGPTPSYIPPPNYLMSNEDSSAYRTYFNRYLSGKAYDRANDLNKTPLRPDLLSRDLMNKLLVEKNAYLDAIKQEDAKKASGGPTPAKAKEMLHDGTAHGVPLTDKQKRYFGWLSHKKQLGGWLDDYNT